MTTILSDDLGSNSNELYQYTIFAWSPGAVSDQDNAKEVNIRPTGRTRDESQKNLELLIQSIGLRAMPIITSEPKATANLAIIGAPTLAGEGFVVGFSVETPAAFLKDGDPVGLLKEELHGIVLHSGVVVKTHGVGKNIEIIEGTI